METSPFDLACKAAGGLTALAKRLGKSKQAVSHYRNGFPDEVCPDVERIAGVPVEELRGDLKWVRIPAEGWPNGKPLLDVAASFAAPTPPDAPAAPAERVA